MDESRVKAAIGNVFEHFIGFSLIFGARFARRADIVIAGNPDSAQLRLGFRRLGCAHRGFGRGSFGSGGGCGAR